MQKNPYEAYRQQSIMTMTQEEMLIKLYDEALKQLTLGKKYITEKDISKTNETLQKAQKILSYLKATLDFQYEISNNLASLYDYFIRLIISANIQKDCAPLDEVIPMVEDLRQTFAEAAKKARSQAAV